MINENKNDGNLQTFPLKYTQSIVGPYLKVGVAIRGSDLLGLLNEAVQK